MEIGTCKDPETCLCGSDVLCPMDFTCVNGKCVNKCNKIKCGPRSVCQEGICVCPAGYTGFPNDLKRGCQPIDHCNNDLDCDLQQICFQVYKGTRKCVDGCKKLQCGPNAFCVTQNHVSSCLCVDGFYGNPGNLIEGCQPHKSAVDISCHTNADCEPGFFCVAMENGLKDCIQPCNRVTCGAHQKCEVDSKGRPTCKCQEKYEWNPIISTCEKPSLPNCKSDKDCKSEAACRPDALGVLKCVQLCKSFTCTMNSQCIASNHQARCQCLAGFTGNPNDRFGCQSVRKDQCSKDVECPEDQTCKLTNDGLRSCQAICNFLTCGPNALCVVHNHVANCKCPPGLYAGDPNDLNKGCQTVPCVYNIDCPSNQLCNLQKHTCYDACDTSACGLNAVCVADDHKAICQCPPGYRANPLADIECTPIEICTPNPCHPTAICLAGSSNNPVCQCPPNHVGDPYGTTGCQLEGHCSKDRDCPVHSICQSGKCLNPCDNACGQNALCEIINGEPICKCIHKFVPSMHGMSEGCVRPTFECKADIDCEDMICLEGQCRGINISSIFIILENIHYQCFFFQ